MRHFISIIIFVFFFIFISCSKTDTPSAMPPVVNSLDSGLIAYYPFNGNANDSSGNKYNLTSQGATLTNDRFGANNKAYHFNGTNAEMIVPKFINADSVAEFSISAWIKPAKSGYIYALSVEPFSPEFESMYVFKDTLTSNFTISYFITQVYYASGGSNTQLFQNIIPDITDTWTHLVLVQDGKGIYLYVNGIKASSSSPNPYVVYFAGGGLIGALEENQVEGHYEGDIDELRFYSRALTEAEIKKLYEQ